MDLAPDRVDSGSKQRVRLEAGGATTGADGRRKVDNWFKSTYKDFPRTSTAELFGSLKFTKNEIKIFHESGLRIF